MSVDTMKVDLRTAVGDDIPPGEMPVKIRCRQPEHEDPGASMCIYPSRIQCFGCGFMVNRRMEALIYLLGVPMPTTRQGWAKFINDKASRYTVESLDNYRDRARLEAIARPLPNGYAAGYNTVLDTIREGRKQWLYDRGLEESTIQFYRLGHNLTQFTIPVWDTDAKLLSIRFRRDDYFGTHDELDRELPKYSGIKGRNGLYLFMGLTGWQHEENHVYVCEGELDALRLAQEDLPACSPTNGVRNLKRIPELLQPYSGIRHLIIVSDMDEPGEMGAQELAEVAPNFGLTTERLTWKDAKDVTEFYQSGGRFS